MHRFIKLTNKLTNLQYNVIMLYCKNPVINSARVSYRLSQNKKLTNK